MVFIETGSWKSKLILLETHANSQIFTKLQASTTSHLESPVVSREIMVFH